MFIYRIPLVEFDPRNKREIQKHWNWVKSAIELSSPGLTEAIQDKGYPELPFSIRQKIFKYLIRGRYRPTPFGMWSGVGIGQWSQKTQSEMEIKLEKQISSTNTRISNIKIWGLPIGIKRTGNKIQFWAYSQDEERWIHHIFSSNPVIEKLVHFFESQDHISQESFSELFESFDKKSKKEVWDKLRFTGFLQNKFQYHEKQKKNQINSYLKTVPILDKRIQSQLDEFINTSGALFVSHDRSLISRFKKFYSNSYDDTFNSLETLLKDNGLFENLNQIDPLDPEENSTLSQIKLGENQKVLDLKKEVKQANQHPAIHDIQVVFRLGKNNEIIVDNLVCNRPFVYSGRFSDYPPIQEYQQLTHQDLLESKRLIFCDVEIFESETINFISKHINLFNHHISPFFDQDSNSIPLNEIYLGIHNQRIILVHRRLNLEIIPVFQHPLNGSQISHPLLRLLWEISNQDSFRFFAYHSGFLLNSSYLPQLNWGKIILQERRWRINKEQFSSKESLFNWLKKKRIPQILSIGNLDQELVLKWNRKDELALLFQELQRKNSLNLSEKISVMDSPFHTKDHTKLYPQFVYQRKPNPKLSDLPYFLNYRYKPDKSCLYLKIQSNRNDLIPVLKGVIPTLVKTILQDFPNLKWYFLCYASPSVEIRLRFLDLGEKDQAKLIGSVYEQFTKQAQNLHFQTANYYPEHEKYGPKIMDLKISELLFTLESQDCLFGYSDQKTPFLCIPEDERVIWIASLFTEVFHHSDLKNEHLKKLGKHFKSLGLEQQKTIRQEIAQLLVSEFEEPRKKFIATYIQSIRNHSNFSDPNKSHILISNHLHMLINRSFPMNAFSKEESIRYLIYRLLGKRIYQTITPS